MTTTSLPRIVLFQVRDPKLKLARLAEIGAFHFERKEHLIIFADDDKAVQFVDEFLWKTPSTSFLPHAALNEASSELIAVTKVKKNLNSARFAFNLCSTPLYIEGPFKAIYDFEDLTTPAKQQLSALRFDAYKKSQYLIESR